MPIFYDRYYIFLVVPAILLSLVVQLLLKNTYAKYKRISNSRGCTGAQMAQELLSLGGAQDVQVECIDGNLTDHFDPRTKNVRLSSDVYHGTSVASIGIAAHECGHALQYKSRYFPMYLRSAVVRITNISSALIYPLVILSVAFEFSQLLELAIICFLIIFLFQLITLPVEFNASRRAVRQIQATNFAQSDVSGVKKVLFAAAMTYVAAMIMALMSFLSFLLRVRRRNR